MAERFDAVIVGAGVIGAAVALELARKGWRTLNLDALPAAGYGSTSASAACIRVHYSTLVGTALAYEGYHYWKRWAEHLGLPAGHDLARYVETGCVVMKTPENGYLRGICANMTALGIPFAEWDRAELGHQLPGFDLRRFAPPRRPDDPSFGETTGEPLAGAVFFPTAGYVGDPQLAARNLQHAAEAAGARFRFNAKVVEVRKAAGRAAGVVLADGTRIEAPVAVNAAGPHSAVVNRMAGVLDEMAVGTRPLRQEVAHVPAPPSLGGKGLLVSDSDVGCYWRTEVGGKLLIGSQEPDCDPLQWVDPDDWHQELSEQWTAQVYRAALRMPDLPIPQSAQGIAALYDVSDDWLPIYDRSGLDGWYMAIGTSGNQFKNAPIVGRLMAELILACEGGHDHDREPLKVTGPHTGLRLDLGCFSRRRTVNRDSSFSVLG